MIKEIPKNSADNEKRQATGLVPRTINSMMEHVWRMSKIL